MLDRPFKRIARPVLSAYEDSYVSGLNERTYLCDSSYASDRRQLIRAYHVIESDLLRIFEYVEPSAPNSNTYSFRLYEILLRAATEFESNCKLILEANGFAKPGRLNITDYYKLQPALRLSDYVIRLENWGPEPLEIRPFESWATTHSLDWYTAYNSVKHNRSNEFSHASLANAIQALGSVLCMLYAQFAFLAFSENEEVTMLSRSADGFESHGDSLFSLKHPTAWTEAERYNFTDDGYRLLQPPLAAYDFN